MNPHADMIEGPEAWTRFQEAVKKVLTVPKSAVHNPFGKRKKNKPIRKASLFVSRAFGASLLLKGAWWCHEL